MKKPKIYQAYNALLESDPSKSREISLKDFIKTYGVSLSALVHAFPKNNRDMRALEAHTWDRLRKFFNYEDFGQARVGTREEVEFINLAVAQIEDWFYRGEWTSCLETPSRSEITEMFESNKPKVSLLKRTRSLRRRPGEQNLGSQHNLGNIHADIQAGEDDVSTYRAHAFKFFQGPAAFLNILTKINSEKPIKFRPISLTSIITGTSGHIKTKFADWHSDSETGSAFSETERNKKTLEESQKTVNKNTTYLKPNEAYKRFLYFAKTCMMAAQEIRQADPSGCLTEKSFNEIMRKMRLVNEGRPKNTILPSYLFSDDLKNFPKNSNVLHVNIQEFPFAIFVVDYLNERRKKAKN